MSAGPSPRLRAASVAALIFLLGVVPLAAQSASGSTAAPGAAAASSTAAAPGEEALPQLEQVKTENPFSRFEIVTLGSFPITIFYVGLGFDFQTWIASGYDSAYAPIFSAKNSSLNDSQRLQRLGIALGVSCLVGTIDAIIHASKVKAAKRLREAKMSIDSADGPVRSGAP